MAIAEQTHNRTMIHFLPQQQVTVQDVNPSLHSQLNVAVKDLGVVCTGAADETLYFDKQTLKAKAIPEAELANDIIQRIMAVPDLAGWMQQESISYITIR